MTFDPDEGMHPEQRERGCSRPEGSEAADISAASSLAEGPQRIRFAREIGRAHV